MAKRRMCAKEILRDDRFMALPNECQLLYFELNLDADDDGFLFGARQIMQALSIPQSAYDKLAKAGYILVFPSGAAVLTHWRENNYIARDRYCPTKYREEMRMLTHVPGFGYRFKDKKTNADEPAAEKENAPASAPTEQKAPAPVPPPTEAVEEEEKTPPENGDAESEELPALPMATGGDYRPSEQEIKEWKAFYSRADVDRELIRMREWLTANPGRRKPPGDMVRFIHAWLSNAQNRDAVRYYGKPRQAAAQSRDPPSYDLARAVQRANTVVPVLKTKR